MFLKLLIYLSSFSSLLTIFQACISLEQQQMRKWFKAHCGGDRETHGKARGSDLLGGL